MGTVALRLIYISLFLSMSGSVLAQVEKRVKPPVGDLPTGKNSILPDSIGRKTDSLANRSDSLARKRRSEIETTINYSARDSINSSMTSKIVHLYGDAQIKYGEIELMAEDVTIDYANSTITASGRLDSLGRRVGYPIFINGAEKYEMKSIVYNFKTKKAKISEVVTKQQEGILHGREVFKNDKNEMLSTRNGYTTCDLAHPHYQIIATKAKAIPGDKIVVGPFLMEVNDVPLPLGFLFGMFPSPRQSASGIIVPVYGEERNRGFFLRNGGYFFDINDYFKMQITGDIYSKGSSGLTINSNYRKRYHHNGSLNFAFTNNVVGDNIESQTTSKDFRLTWSHSPQSRGTGRFSASVNAATASYNTNNFLPLNTNPSIPRIDATSRKLSSNVSYSKTFGTLFSLGLNYRINQDLTTKQVDMPLPDVTFNINNIYPFKKTAAKGLVFQNLSLRYTMSGSNQITNNLGKVDPEGNYYTDNSGKLLTHDSIAAFNGANFPLFIQNAKKGIRQNIPIATSFKILKFFTISPSINIDELWYFEKLHWRPSADSLTAVSTITHQFNTVTNYSVSASMTTRIYGTYFFKKGSGVQAIRHVINPSVGFSYQPDFGDPSYGYYETLRLKNNPNLVYKSVHEGFVYGSSRVGESASMNFGINNNVEMKVMGKKDTVARKVALFNTLSISSAYNFKADSFKLAPFALAANTNVLNDKLNVNLSGTLDPYRYVQIESNGIHKEIRTNTVAWNTSYTPTTEGWGIRYAPPPGIGRITNANLALSTNLSAKGQKQDTDTKNSIAKSNISDSDKQYLLQNPDSYIDFKIPWNFRVSYNADYSHPVNSNPIITQAIRFNGDFNLTEKWKIVYNSGYDFQQGEITTTQFTISRDLHCWLINLSWVPFGKFQSYSFYIGVKSSLLKDLKLNRNRSYFDN